MFESVCSSSSARVIDRMVLFILQLFWAWESYIDIISPGITMSNKKREEAFLSLYVYIRISYIFFLTVSKTYCLLLPLTKSNGTCYKRIEHLIQRCLSFRDLIVLEFLSYQKQQEGKSVVAL